MSYRRDSLTGSAPYETSLYNSPIVPFRGTPKGKSSDPQSILSDTLNQLSRLDTTGAFQVPVTDDIAPGYSAIISHPMDFGTMRSKLKKGNYKNINHLERDLELIITNCTTYNPVDNYYHLEALRIRSEAQPILQAARSKLAQLSVTDASPAMGAPPGGRASKLLEEAFPDLLDKLSRLDYESFFQEPITDEIVPGYTTIIKHPMAFSTMRKKLARHQYSTLQQFQADFNRICDNCTTFNPAETIWAKAALRMKKEGNEILESAKSVLSLAETSSPPITPRPTHTTSSLASPPPPATPSSTPELEVILNDTLDTLSSLDEQNYFQHPMTPEQLTRYGMNPQFPMDFGTMRKRLQKHHYKSLDKLEYDFHQIVQNASLAKDPLKSTAVLIRTVGDEVIAKARNKLSGAPEVKTVHASIKGERKRTRDEADMEERVHTTPVIRIKAPTPKDEPETSKPVAYHSVEAGLTAVLGQLSRLDRDGIFQRPVTSLEAPGYFDIVKRPMDFTTMAEKVSQKKYRNLEQFETDFYLIVDNCMLYNPVEHTYHQLALRMKKSGERILKHERASLLNVFRDPIVASSPAPLKQKTSVEDDHVSIDSPATRPTAAPVSVPTSLIPQPVVSIPDGLSKTEAAMWLILDNLSKRDRNKFFQAPVTAEVAPDYDKVITKPMDFGTMREKLLKHEYASLEPFIEDFHLICLNCMTYNGPQTVYYKTAHKLLKEGDQYITKERVPIDGVTTPLMTKIPVLSTTSTFAPGALGSVKRRDEIAELGPRVPRTSATPQPAAVLPMPSSAPRLSQRELAAKRKYERSGRYAKQWKGPDPQKVSEEISQQITQVLSKLQHDTTNAQEPRQQVPGAIQLTPFANTPVPFAQTVVTSIHESSDRLQDYLKSLEDFVTGVSQEAQPFVANISADVVMTDQEPLAQVARDARDVVQQQETSVSLAELRATIASLAAAGPVDDAMEVEGTQTTHIPADPYVQALLDENFRQLSELDVLRSLRATGSVVQPRERGLVFSLYHSFITLIQRLSTESMMSKEVVEGMKNLKRQQLLARQAAKQAARMPSIVRTPTVTPSYSTPAKQLEDTESNTIVDVESTHDMDIAQKRARGRPKKEPHFVCANCRTQATPNWRLTPDDIRLCNECGVHYKRNNEHRPLPGSVKS